MGEKGTKEKKREKKFSTPKLYMYRHSVFHYTWSFDLVVILTNISLNQLNKKCYFIISRMIMHVSESMNFEAKKS